MDERNDYNSIPMQPPVKTAMQELWDYIDANYHEEGFNLCDAKEISLEKEKEQIIQAWIVSDNPLQRTAAEGYYNLTYHPKSEAK